MASTPSSNGSSGRYPSYPPPVDPAAESGSRPIRKSLLEMLEVFRRGKWYVLAIFLLIFSSVTAYTFLQAPKFMAYSLLVIDPSVGSATDEALSAGKLGSSTLDVRSQILTLQESLYIAENTARRLQELERIPETGHPLHVLEKDGVPLSLAELVERLQQDRVDVRSEGDWRAGAIRISAVSDDPNEAALLANIYADEYEQLSQQSSRHGITASREFLEQQITKQRDKLADIERQLSAHMRNQDAAALVDEGTGFTAAQVAQFEANLDEARIDKRVHEVALQSLESELQQLQPHLASQLSSGVESEIKRVQDRVAEAESIIERIYLRNPNLRSEPSGNEELIALLAQRETLRSQLGVLVDDYVGNLANGSATASTQDESISRLSFLSRQIADERTALKTVEARITALEQRLDVYRGKLRALPEQSMRYANLERARLATEEIYNSLIAKLHEVRLAEESEIGYVHVIRPAVIPTEPVTPKKAKNLIVGFIMATMMGTLAAVLRHWLDGRVYTPDDIRGSGLKVLATIPDMKKEIRAASKDPVHLPDSSGPVSPVLFALRDPISAIAEAYRHFYVDIQFGAQDSVVQTILVTSAEPGAGKSTTALNLAVTTARAHRRTLLVDADLHRPVTHTLLGRSSPVDLPHLLELGDCIPFDRFSAGVDDLFIVTSPEPYDNPSDLLRSARMRRFIERARAEFDIIIFDSPPILLISDALILATQCDVSFIMARAGQTDGGALAKIAEDFEEVGVTPKGVVLNGFRPTLGYKNTYGYRYREYHKYYRRSKV